MKWQGQGLGEGEGESDIDVINTTCNKARSPVIHCLPDSLLTADWNISKKSVMEVTTAYS